MARTWSAPQRRLLAGCAILYAGAYACRLNLSALMSAISREFHLSAAAGALPITLFAVLYAGGQVMSGALSERLPARRQITCGLVLSALLNALAAASRGIGMLCAIWSLNGLSQSLIWTPVVVLVGRGFGEGQRRGATFALSLSTVCGHALAWSAALGFNACVGWRAALLGSALITLLLALIGLGLVKSGAPGTSVPAHRNAECGGASAQPARLFSLELALVLCCCLCHGYLRDGVVNWAGSVLEEGPGAAFSLVIPLINVLGLLGGWLLVGPFRVRSYRAIALAALLTTPCVLLLLGGAPDAWAAPVLGAIYALMYSVNPILTTLIPLTLDGGRHAGLVAGIVDCVIYVGSALSGSASGALKDAAGWPALFLSWLLTSGACALLAPLCARMGNARARRGESSLSR